MDILEQGIKDGIEDVVDKGVGFLKDIGSAASSVAKKLFGW